MAGKDDQEKSVVERLADPQNNELARSMAADIARRLEADDLWTLGELKSVLESSLEKVRQTIHLRQVETSPVAELFKTQP